MPDRPETQYAETEVGRIAYQIVGDGPTDVLVSHPLAFPIDHMWDEPSLVQFLDGLSRFCRHIWFDPRGRGASDPAPPGQDLLQETFVDDVVALVDHLELDRVALLGLGPPAMPMFAATHPERTTALVLVNYVAGLIMSGTDDESFAMFRNRWGTTGFVGSLAGAPQDVAFARWLAKAQRLTCTADQATMRRRAAMSVDLQKVLEAIAVPTLVLSRPANPSVGESGNYYADHIPTAKLVELPGTDLIFFRGDIDSVLDPLSEFLTGKLPIHGIDRVLATVLFTDIVGSTDHLARAGDRGWWGTRSAHDAITASEIERHRGRQINTTGDGVLATFDGPGRAIRCAQAITEAVRSLGIEVRAGIHTCEIELRGDDIGGIGVHIASRVSGLAGPGEVLVSRTVTDLVAGSGIEFEDRGEQELKGVPGSWRVYSVRV